MTAARTVTVLTSDHGPITTPEPDWCRGRDIHRDGGRREEIAHLGPPIDITVGTLRGPRRLLELVLCQEPFPPASSPHGTAVHVVAHLLDGDHFGYDAPGLERLAADLIDAARRVRLVARRLASEARR